MKKRILISLAMVFVFCLLVARGPVQAEPQRHGHGPPELLIVHDIKADVVRARIIRANDVHAETCECQENLRRQKAAQKT